MPDDTWTVVVVGCIDGKRTTLTVELEEGSIDLAALPDVLVLRGYILGRGRHIHGDCE